jgi:hypothetical protein
MTDRMDPWHVTSSRNIFTRLKESESSKIAEQLHPLEHVLLLVAMGLVIVTAGVVFLHALLTPLRFHPPWHAKSYGAGLVRAVNDGVLILILVEVAQTVRQQINETRVTAVLVRSFFGIGILAAIRHTVTLGAQLSVTAASKRTATTPELLREFALNAAIILILVFGFWIASREAQKGEPPTPTQEGERPTPNGDG